MCTASSLEKRRVERFISLEEWTVSAKDGRDRYISRVESLIVPWFGL